MKLIKNSSLLFLIFCLKINFIKPLEFSKDKKAQYEVKLENTCSDRCFSCGCVIGLFASILICLWILKLKSLNKT